MRHGKRQDSAHSMFNLKRNHGDSEDRPTRPCSWKRLDLRPAPTIGQRPINGNITLNPTPVFLSLLNLFSFTKSFVQKPPQAVEPVRRGSDVVCGEKTHWTIKYTVSFVAALFNMAFQSA